MTIRLLVAFVLATFASVSHAAVAESSADGFKVHHAFTVGGKTGDEVWAALIDIGRWWNKEHSYSGDAANLKLDATAGGCFCERFGNASVQHMTVINAIPKGMLRMTGGLGPLQELPVTGVMSWTFKKADGGGITVSMDYVVAGRAAGLKALEAPVDGVLGEQVSRLERLLKTGSPEPAGKP
ncbi:MAG TPA: hypothetical protein VJM11_16675 [Nevskiaceae bacterium]|nr:hypothetical protein [Nevskiaceae bacterium]